MFEGFESELSKLERVGGGSDSVWEIVACVNVLSPSFAPTCI